jgi:hypothetical protein
MGSGNRPGYFLSEPAMNYRCSLCECLPRLRRNMAFMLSPTNQIGMNPQVLENPSGTLRGFEQTSRISVALSVAHHKLPDGRCIRVNDPCQFTCHTAFASTLAGLPIPLSALPQIHMNTDSTNLSGRLQETQWSRRATRRILSKTETDRRTSLNTRFVVRPVQALL